MNKWTQNVLEFHEKFEVDILQFPAIPPLNRRWLRRDLIKEEVAELEEAMVNKSIVDVADGIVDLLYVTIGTAIEFGLQDKLEELFAEVHRSNMSKLHNGKVLKRDDGKVLKSLNYSPADLAKILEV